MHTFLDRFNTSFRFDYIVAFVRNPAESKLQLSKNNETKQKDNQNTKLKHSRITNNLKQIHDNTSFTPWSQI